MRVFIQLLLLLLKTTNSNKWLFVTIYDDDRKNLFFLQREDYPLLYIVLYHIELHTL